MFWVFCFVLPEQAVPSPAHPMERILVQMSLLLQLLLPATLQMKQELNPLSLSSPLSLGMLVWGGGERSLKGGDRNEVASQELTPHFSPGKLRGYCSPNL